MRDTMGMKKVGKWGLIGREMAGIGGGGAFGMKMILRLLLGKQSGRGIHYDGSNS